MKQNTFLRLMLLCSVLWCAGEVRGQVITTFAGGGSGGDGIATAALINDPGGGAVDKYGNFYFVQCLGGNRVSKVNTCEFITTVAGNGTAGFSGDNGTATLAELNLPAAVTLDSVGNLFIADGNSNHIRRVDVVTGIITTISGNGTGGFGGDGSPASAATLWDPQDICFDKFGNLYIADLANNRVRKINSAGMISTFAGTGVSTSTGDGGPATNATTSPWGLCTDDTGNVYIAEEGTGLCKVRKVNTEGIISTVAGTGGYVFSTDGIPATAANIDPVRVAFRNGELFIADQFNERIFKVDAMGIIHTVAGDGSTAFGGDGGPATSAQIYYPAGVTIDSCGNIYIADVGHNRIRMIFIDTLCYSRSSCDIPLGFNKIKNIDNVILYPNPINEMLVIEGALKINTVAISNYIGEILMTEVFDAEKVELNLRSIPPGVYMVKITVSNGQKTIRKIVKQ